MNEPAKHPLVSVVLATFNGEQFLETQLESIFQQAFHNIELVVVDDGSKDNTLSILHAYSQKHPNMKVFQNENNLGFVKNFEKGCSLSTGDFIALCDQDDYWHPQKIERMIAAIGTHPMIYCNSVLCDQDLNDTGLRISDQVICRNITNCLQQAVFCRTYGHATLFTRRLYGLAAPFLEVIPHDWWLAYIATLHGGIKYLDEPLVFYRQHSTNVFGAVGGKRRKKEKLSRQKKKKKELNAIRTRIKAFYNQCPEQFTNERKILRSLVKSYSSFSFSNNIQRVVIFLRYHHLLLAVKRRSLIRKYLFCFKMFAIIR